MHFKEHLLHPLNSGFASASPKALALQAALQATTQLPLLVVRQSLIACKSCSSCPNSYSD